MAIAALARSWKSRLGPPVFFTALAVLNSWPLALAPATSIGAHGDAYFSVWRLAWVAHTLATGSSHVFDANIFYPEPNTLAYSDAMLLPAVFAAPLGWAGLPPVLVYNLVLLGAFVASGLAAFALVRWLTGSVGAGLLGGTIFAFSPHRMEHFDHLELQFAFWIPLVVLAWHRAVESRRPDAYLIASLLVCGQLLSSIYHGIFLMAWLGVMTIAWFHRRYRDAAVALACVLGPASLLLAVYSIPYLQSRAAVGERSVNDVKIYSATPVDFVSAPESNRVYGWTSTSGANERHLFPGAAALALAVIGLTVSRDRRIRIHAVGLAFALVLTLGTTAGLYSLLYEWVLPFRGLRVPARAGILVLLGTAVLAGTGLVWLGARWSRARWLPAVALLLATVEFASAPRLIDVDAPISPWYRTLSKLPDVVVFEWPVTVPWRLHDMRDVRYMYRSLEHWQPLLNGYSGNYPSSYLELLVEMRAFPYTRALNYLRRRGATVLVVHEVPGLRPSFEATLERLHREPGVNLVGRGLDAGDRVAFFRLDPAVPSVRGEFRTK
jgi:hypothetical protein